MSFIVKICLALILILAHSVASADITRDSGTENAGHLDRSFRVTYADGDVERYLVRYNATVEKYEYESGHPAKNFQTDTRQCHWTIKMRIERTVFLVSHTGKPATLDKLASVWNQPMNGKGSDFVVTSLHPENCNQAGDRYSSDLDNARQRVADQLDPVSTADLTKIKDQLKSDLKADSISEVNQ
jgi:hypothetical protein